MSSQCTALTTVSPSKSRGVGFTAGHVTEESKHNIAHQCSKLEHATPSCSTSPTHQTVQPNVPLDFTTTPLYKPKPPLSLQHRPPMNLPLTPSNAQSNKRNRRKKERKHSYCLLQSLLKYRNPSFGKRGESSRSGKERRDVCVCVYWGGGAQRLPVAEEGRARRQMMKKTGMQKEKKRGKKKGSRRKISALQRIRPPSTAAARNYKVSGVPLHAEG